MKLSLLLLLVAAAAPVRAADKTLILSGNKSEDVLRRFVERDPQLKAKLDDAAAQEEETPLDGRDPDLRDAVSDRAGLLSQLPGLKTVALASCRSLSDCATPDLALDVSDAELLPGAVRGLLRPWMLLQQARGSELRVTPIGAEGDAILAVKLRDLDAPTLTLKLAPRPLGGFKIWFDQPLFLAALYGRERDAALKSPR